MESACLLSFHRWVILGRCYLFEIDIPVFFFSLKSQFHVWWLETMDEGCKKEVKKKAVKVGDELDVLGIDLNRFLMEVGFLIAFLKMNFPWNLGTQSGILLFHGSLPRIVVKWIQTGGLAKRVLDFPTRNGKKNSWPTSSACLIARVSEENFNTCLMLQGQFPHYTSRIYWKQNFRWEWL